MCIPTSYELKICAKEVNRNISVHSNGLFDLENPSETESFSDYYRINNFSRFVISFISQQIDPKFAESCQFVNCEIKSMCSNN